MPTPLYTTLRDLAAQDTLRLHMPGHKGISPVPEFAAAMPLDYTEIPATGNLFEPGGPIGEAEALWAELTGASDCVFSAGGATLGLQAALASVAKPGDAVLLDRGCHQSVCHAMALLDLHPAYVLPGTLEPWGVSAGISAAALEAALAARPAKAVVVTSPTYYGICCDIPALAAVCRAHGAALIVDQAHGAHFAFVGLRNACAEGADYCVISAHKTLPALGGAAMVLCGNGRRADSLRRWAAVFASTSPSYLLMASMDAARGWLLETGAYTATPQLRTALAAGIRARTPFLPLEGDDPCRLCVCTAAGGIDGFAAAEGLRSAGIEVELADSRNVVGILTCMDTDAARILDAFAALGGAPTAVPPLPALPAPVQRSSPRAALFAESETLPLCEAVGRIAARPVTPYPPGIPVIAPGEEVTKKHIAYLANICYNIHMEFYAVHPQEGSL